MSVHNVGDSSSSSGSEGSNIGIIGGIIGGIVAVIIVIIIVIIVCIVVCCKRKGMYMYIGNNRIKLYCFIHVVYLHTQV